MTTDTEQLAIIKSQTLTRIVEITAKPKPTYEIDGQEVEWAEYLETLQKTIKWVDEQLSTESPYEIHSIAVPT